MNSVQIVGNVGNVIELNKTPDGTSAVRVSIAYRRNKDKTDWFRCNAYGATAEFIHKYVKQGQQIGITGRLYTEQYKGKDGSTHEASKIFVTECTLLSGQKEGGSKETESKPRQEPTKAQEKPTDDDFNTGPLLDISSDDLPF